MDAPSTLFEAHAADFKAEGGHLFWTGPTKRGEPRLDIKTSRSVRLLLWRACPGKPPVPPGKRLRETCGAAGCLLPAHQEVVAYQRGAKPLEPKPYTPATRCEDDVRRIWAVYQTGLYSYQQIAEALGVTRQRVAVVVKRYREHLAAIQAG